MKRTPAVFAALPPAALHAVQAPPRAANRLSVTGRKEAKA